MPNSDYPDLICIHIHLAILSLSKYTPRASWQVCSLSAVLITGKTIVFRNVTFYPRSPEVEPWVFRWTFFSQSPSISLHLKKVILT